MNKKLERSVLLFVNFLVVMSVVAAFLYLQYSLVSDFGVFALLWGGIVLWWFADKENSPFYKLRRDK